jgi:hypothetical protein
MCSNSIRTRACGGKHQGWKEPVEFMHHCSTKWGVFLLSPKSLLETGKGGPWPNEIKLDSWE